MTPLAWRNLWRRPWRTSLVAACLALVVLASLLLFAFAAAMRRGLLEEALRATGAVVVTPAGEGALGPSGKRLLRDVPRLQEEVAAAARDAGVTVAVSAVLEAPAVAFAAERSHGAFVRGGDTTTGGTTTGGGAQRARTAGGDDGAPRHAVLAGRLPAADETDAVALGASLAAALGLAPGGSVTLYLPDAEGLGAATFAVVGVLDLPDAVEEARAAWLPLTAAQALVAPGSATRLELHPRAALEERDLARVRDATARRLGPGFAVRTWRDAYPDLATLLGLLTPIMATFSAMFFGMAGLLVVNTVSLSVAERIREYGLLAALGAGRRTVLGVVLRESILLVGLGTAVGGAAGGWLVAALHHGFRLPFGLAETYAAFGFPLVLYASISPAQIVLVLAFTAATAVAAALAPALTAATAEPAEAMRIVG